MLTQNHRLTPLEKSPRWHLLAKIKIVVNGLASKTFLIHFYYYTQLA